MACHVTYQCHVNSMNGDPWDDRDLNAIMSYKKFNLIRGNRHKKTQWMKFDKLRNLMVELIKKCARKVT
jgi:hypothetical protein